LQLKKKRLFCRQSILAGKRQEFRLAEKSSFIEGALGKEVPQKKAGIVLFKQEKMG